MQVRNRGLRTSEKVIVIDAVQIAGGTRESSGMFELDPHGHGKAWSKPAIIPSAEGQTAHK